MKRSDLINHLINFLAVILGVLLAFWINEKSIRNREQAEASELINALATDLKEDAATFATYQIPTNLEYQKRLDALIAALESGNIEEVNQLLPVIFQVQNYSPTASSYNSMKASGKLRLIEDLKLQKNLSDYFDGEVLESSLKGEAQVDYLMKDLLPWITDHVDLSKMELNSAEALIGLKNRAIIYKSLADQKIVSYQRIQNEAEILHKQLDSLGALR